MHKRLLRTALVTAAASLSISAAAQAATLTVDDDKADCPTAGYTSIQSAIDAASSGDTVTVCAGDYVEGSGAVGSNALTITKNLTLKGAGADLVTISPRATSPIGGQIMEATPNLRNGLGDVVAVVGAPTKPLSVNISGVTVDGWDPDDKPIVVEAGIVYLDASGSILRSRVTNTVTSEGDNAFNQAGGYRGTQPGIGIVQTSAALQAPVDGTRTLDIELTRVDKYNKIGVLIDGAQNDTPPLVASGTINRGQLVSDQIVGRTECINYQGTGNCSTVGPVLTGPLFGQDGLRVTAGGRAQVFGSLISQNVVQGLNAPIRNSATNNANLTLGAGIRLIGARMTTPPVNTGLPTTYNTSATTSNITDNAYGALNYALDGTTSNSTAGNIFLAENNWWGLRITGATNPGPAVSPTTNPPFPENPVNGTSVADTTFPTFQTSNAVDFYPFRRGLQADTASAADPNSGGEYPIVAAPIPMNDAAPSPVTLTSSVAEATAGAAVTLSAAASDDYGVKKVRFYDGGTLLGTVATPPYTLAATLPGDAACGSVHSYTALATDSIDQTTRSATAPVTVKCAAAPTNPGTTTTTPPVVPVTPAPTVKFSAAPTKLTATSVVTLAVTGSVKSVVLRLGNRVVCTFTKAPYSCKIKLTGADVGTQALTASVTDTTGATVTVTTKVTVPKFKATVSLSITSKKLKGGKLTKRTIKGKLVRPSGVTLAQACKSGKVTLTIKRAGRSFYNQQVTLTPACTFTRSVTAARKKQSFSVSAQFGGNAVLATATTSRRFS